MGEWSYSSTILDLHIRWRLAVSFTPRSPYPWGYPLDRRLGGAQSWSRHCGVKKNQLPLPGIESWPSRLQPVAISTKLHTHTQIYRQ
jgi:hypothetical protein